jgi:poly(U)-specific endoribonuclease
VLQGLGAGAAFVGFGPWLGARRAQAAAPLYQRIWDADQASRGVPALLPGQRGDPAIGFVVVDERGARDPDHRLFLEVVIPDAKRATYDLCQRLFDNYGLDQTKRETTTPEEASEILELLEAVTDSPPMEVARAKVEQTLGRALSRDDWQSLLFEVWFRSFDDGRNLDLTGFEHVVIGEQRAGAVSGHHFWYKYYLEDGGLLPPGRDAIDWDGTRYDGASGRDGRLTPEGRRVPEVVTLAYRWRAYDHEAGAARDLFQRIGGFFVGCSVEGLLALGTARFFDRGHRATVLNGARYEIALYRSPDKRSLRTFFPRFLGLA